METVEIIGLAASVLVLISFLMREVRIIRIISIFGCIFWIVYGVWLGAWSVWILNSILIIVHIVFLAVSFSRKRKQGSTAAAKPDHSTHPAHSTNQRLQRFSSDAFSKKGLRSLPWFVTSDME